MVVPMALPKIAFVAFVVPFFLSPPARAGEDQARAWLASQGYAEPTAERIVACHGYGCSRRASVRIDGAIFGKLSAIMRSGRGSPAAERRALSEAIRIFTRYVAARIGGRLDAPRSPPSLSGVHGQMDCLDVTANTTSLLLVLEANGLLIHHDISRPEARGFLLDGRWPHVTAVLAESQGGTRWAVDPWTRAPGAAPEILPLSQWHRAS